MPTRRLFIARALATPLAAPMLARPALADTSIRLRDLYRVRGTGLSDLARASAGQRLSVSGFMAPPLKAESRFFVLTKRPMAVCPFCESEADWPNDILAVYTKRVVDVSPFNVLITVSGVLELGSYRDPDTGFVSMVRLSDASYA
ncbi:hypothetical protein AL036_04160 [Salipiger aestuarii]|uniref:Secreted protein n=1 Tax=Salipiger aestuarii TaxID=568098 RepID=A0A327YJU1_9RHOB|nr:hypothetical protein [Salipiger aestuarii]KAA8609349.1 hypothetical protein AL036_04160 [Salipiger aestuarii]KAA8615246.1 hypothetical protein AL037_03175 [Salipiger aestuarii]KAB2542959.1 hypothetical protein AL035_04435 [Salipiger aestuarii]RAK20781.1 hypothetical protein ATI53_100529 [Salipiger aestuarii]